MDVHDPIILALRLTSGLCWTAVYVRVIAVGARDKTCGLPFLVLSANLAWEGVFGYVLDYGPQAGPQQRINQLWFLFDLGIACLYVRYGNPGETFPATRVNRSWWLAAVAGAFGAVMYGAAIENGVHVAARPAAFIQNLVMSILFIDMMQRSRSSRGQALDIAVLKLVGTAAATTYLTVLTGSLLIAVLGIAIAGYDVAYVAMLARDRRHVVARVAEARPARPSRRDVAGEPVAGLERCVGRPIPRSPLPGRT